MQKLQLNKKTVSQMEQREMAEVKGGLCLRSCPNVGTRRLKKCCDLQDILDLAGGEPIAQN